MAHNSNAAMQKASSVFHTTLRTYDIFLKDQVSAGSNRQLVFIYNSMNEGMVYSRALGKDSKRLGKFTTKYAEFGLSCWSAILPVACSGENYLQGNVYSVTPEVFRGICGFESRLSLIRVKLSGFKKRVWMFAGDAKPPFQSFGDRPPYPIYSPKDSTVSWEAVAPMTAFLNPTLRPNQPTTPIIETKGTTPSMTQAAANTTARDEPVDVVSDPNITTDTGEVINVDTVSFQILEAADSLEQTIFDHEMDAHVRGKKCKEQLAKLRTIGKTLAGTL